MNNKKIRSLADKITTVKAAITYANSIVMRKNKLEKKFKKANRIKERSDVAGFVTIHGRNGDGSNVKTFFAGRQ